MNAGNSAKRSPDMLKYLEDSFLRRDVAGRDGHLEKYTDWL